MTKQSTRNANQVLRTFDATLKLPPVCDFKSTSGDLSYSVCKKTQDPKLLRSLSFLQWQISLPDLSIEIDAEIKDLNRMRSVGLKLGSTVSGKVFQCLELMSKSLSNARSASKPLRSLSLDLQNEILKECDSKEVVSGLDAIAAKSFLIPTEEYQEPSPFHGGNELGTQLFGPVIYSWLLQYDAASKYLRERTAKTSFEDFMKDIDGALACAEKNGSQKNPVKTARMLVGLSASRDGDELGISHPGIQREQIFSIYSIFNDFVVKSYKTSETSRNPDDKSRLKACKEFIF